MERSKGSHHLLNVQLNLQLYFIFHRIRWILGQFPADSRKQAGNYINITVTQIIALKKNSVKLWLKPKDVFPYNLYQYHNIRQTQLQPEQINMITGSKHIYVSNLTGGWCALLFPCTAATLLFKSPGVWIAQWSLTNEQLWVSFH